MKALSLCNLTTWQVSFFLLLQDSMAAYLAFGPCRMSWFRLKSFDVYFAVHRIHSGSCEFWFIFGLYCPCFATVEKMFLFVKSYEMQY